MFHPLYQKNLNLLHQTYNNFNGYLIIGQPAYNLECRLKMFLCLLLMEVLGLPKQEEVFLFQVPFLAFCLI